MINDSDIAVVGMSCVFPGARDLNSYWDNIINKVDAIQIAPENRIAKVFYDPGSNDIDRLYCNKGGFIGDFLDFNPIEFGIVPNTINGTEPEHLLSLKMTSLALKDAGVFEKNISLEKAGIIIGKGGFAGKESTKVYETVVGGESLIQLLKILKPSLTDTELYDIKKKYQAQNSNFCSQTVMGTVPNLLASLVANRYNFGGPAYTLDAACASGLVAIDHAVSELLRQRCDIFVAGAIHLTQNPALWTVFSQLGALSKKQIIRPFDKKADGLLAGEGCGFVVLRRLKDAIKDDQKIYAIIKGIGISSDGSSASVMSPSAIGQIKAIKEAWQNTSIDYNKIGYVEAHGTATILGDKTELQSLKEIFPYQKGLPKAGIGSVKSMIGHAMPAAAMAGFIRTVMALHKGVLPPTLHCDEPVDIMYETRFSPVQETTDWEQTDLPFVAGVNAFGFGGINAHVVIEKFNATNGYKKIYNIPNENKTEDKILLLARNSKEELIEALQLYEKSIGNGKYRLALFNPSADRIDLAVKIIKKDKPWRNKKDIWFTNEPLLTNGGKLAFLFPGLDVPGLQSLSTSNFKKLANYFNITTLSYFEHQDGLKQFFGLDEACRMMDTSLKKLGIFPDVVAGHSIGEWTACTTVGMVNEKTVQMLNERALNRKQETIDAVFLNVNCGIEEIKDLLKQHKRVYLSNDNCPHQITLSCRQSDAEKFRKLLDERGILSYILPFKTGYHSPFIENQIDDIEYCIKNLINYKPPQYPIWSAITAQPYPQAVEDIQKLTIDFLTKPVLFRQLIENLFKNGVRMFIQIGAGSLTGFVSNTLKGENFSIVSSASNHREVLNQLKRVLAAIFIEGKEIDTHFLGLGAESKAPEKNGLSVKIDISSPLIDYSNLFSNEGLKKIQYNNNKAKVDNTILKVFSNNLEEINNNQRKLLDILSKQKLNTGSTLKENSQTINQKRKDIKKSIEISLTKYPELIDHCPFRKESATDDFSHEKVPVVPLTMFIDLLIDTFEEYYPELKISKIINLRVYKFLWALKPVIIDISGKWITQNSIQFEIEGYLNATLEINQVNKTELYPSIPISGEKRTSIKAEDIYKDGYMFHGPMFQGIKKITAFTDEMLETYIQFNSGKGVLLDNMGQTFGLFIHLIGKNIRAFPVGFEEMIFFNNPTERSGEFTCATRISKEDNEFLYAEIELKRNGKKWCFIKNWQVKKSGINETIWSMMNYAEEEKLSTQIDQGIMLMPRLYTKANTWFTILNIYLNTKEIEYYDSLSLVKQKDYLLGRVAAKDAIRHVVEEAFKYKSHPASYTILNDATGKPNVITKTEKKINISIAHKDSYAVAYASIDKQVGIDIEEIKERDQGFIELVLTDPEKLLLAQFHDKNEWITRFWVAKEAYGKFTGDGLHGNPKGITVSSIKDETFKVDNIQIKTIKYKNFIIGYTI